jgi:hypothetical protein
MSRGRWEYQIQEGIRSLLRLAGFKVYWLSQYRRANQEPGLPDLLVMHIRLGIEATIECKTPNGKLTGPQAEFAAGRQRCGRMHLIGGLEVVQAWLVEQGLAEHDRLTGQFTLTPKRSA